MADDKSKRGGQDRTRIDVSEPSISHVTLERESHRESFAAIVRNLKHAWFVAIALVIAACAATPGYKGSATQHKGDKLEGVPLVWKPTNQPGSLNVTEFAGAAEVNVWRQPLPIDVAAL